MQNTKEQAKAEVARLVERVRQLDSAQVRAYNEANTKKDFVRPLFEALGWNFQGQQEVSEEHPVGSGRADYLFRIRGVSQFYVEAKRLGSELGSEPKWTEQAISYAYNKGIPWAVLTNFKELWLFVADEQGRRFITLNLEQYFADFDRLLLLAKESVDGGRLNDEARKAGALRPSIPVEKRLYQQLRDWRERLFETIIHTRELTLVERDEIIQRLFNRLIFIRTCEDRQLDDPVLTPLLRQHLASHGRGRPLMEQLRRVFNQFEGDYDSELFEHHLVDEVHIDDDLLEEILNGLHVVPRGAAVYDFSLIDADILGRVYEQYLGYVAQVAARSYRQFQMNLALGYTTGQPTQDTIEVVEAPKRRKAQGIYYTPKWVVDYIIRETVGRFIEEHKNRPAAIHEVKILDMACGSGSFLISAYDELLRWHARSSRRSETHVFADERLPIMHNSIFGVDLDPQAVEIARLNLLLRALARHERLPSLEENVRCGNSLISGTEAELRAYFGDGWEEKRPFNWEEQFPDIMTRGGFDVVIGNPPYAGFQGFDEDKPYLRDQYQCAKGRFDIYMPFIEKGLSLLSEGGVLGFICPTNFMKRQHGAELREALKGHTTIEALIDFEHTQVFEEAINYTCVLLLRKVEPTETHKIRYWPGGLESKPYEIEQSKLRKEGWRFAMPNETKLFSKLSVGEVAPLGQLVEGIYEGIVTGANAVFLLPKTLAGQLALEQLLVKPAIRGKEIERWIADEPSHVLLYPYLEAAGRSNAILENVLETGYPNVYQYLKAKRPNLGGRPYFNRSGKNWYELWNERSFDKQQVTKIVVQEVASSAKFALSSEGQFYLDTVCGLVLKDQARNNILYILGLLNSKLLDFNYKRITVPKAGGFYIYKTMFLRHLPIRRIDFSDATDKEMHSSLVALVERMLALQERLKPLRGTGLTEEHDLLREVERVDAEIDNLVYDLYGLTEEERRLVEGG